jgi:cysteine desulfurase family protein
MIYLDNAATSWPKPPCVAKAMSNFMRHAAANPGRSAHRMALDSARQVYEAREAVSELFQAPDPLSVIFTANVTTALNTALFGLLQPKMHVITSSMEHNAVMRPLRELERRGVALTIVNCDQGVLDPFRIQAAIRQNTRLIAITNASNVTGTIFPIAAIGKIAREHGILLLVDAAQTAGAIPINLEKDGVDLFAFTGHKSLYGPMGTGGLIFGERVDLHDINPLIHGGTGSASEYEDQPEFLPDKFESGTPNAVGLAGLAASIRWLQKIGPAAIREKEQTLTAQLIRGLENIPAVTLQRSPASVPSTGVVSFTLDNMDPAIAGARLDEEYDILCRIGLHCSPAAHHTMGTFPNGSIRFGIGYFNTAEEIDRAIDAVSELAKVTL